MKVDVRKLIGSGMLLMSIAVLLLPTNPATGTITVTGDVTPAYTGSPDPWSISGDLKLGNTGAASMTLSGGSKVTDVNAYMGYLAGSTATASSATPAPCGRVPAAFTSAAVEHRRAGPPS